MIKKTNRAVPISKEIHWDRVFMAVTQTGSIWVMERFGKFWILITQFSSNSKVLETERFLKMTMESFGFWLGTNLNYPEVDIT